MCGESANRCSPRVRARPSMRGQVGPDVQPPAPRLPAPRLLATSAEHRPFTSSYGSLQTPGTLLCEAAEYSTRVTPLSVAEIKHLSTGELRRLHPTELLAA